MNKLELKIIGDLRNAKAELLKIPEGSLNGQSMVVWINSWHATFTQAKTLWGGLLEINLRDKIAGFENIVGGESGIIRANLAKVIDQFINEVDPQGESGVYAEEKIDIPEEGLVNFSVDKQYGLLESGFSFSFHPGYVVLTGKNNSGKSSVLQYVFKSLYENHDGKYNNLLNDSTRDHREQICLLLPERMHIRENTQVGSRRLLNFNIDLHGSLVGKPRNNYAGHAPDYSEILALIFDTNNRNKQVLKLDELLENFGLGGFDEKSGQNIFFRDDGQKIGNRGSGQRNIMTILAALENPLIKVVMVDEPELGIEPKLQKMLRDKFYEYAKTKCIIISTHSHLFLNQRDPESSLLVKNNGHTIEISPLSRDSVSNLVFELLGCSVGDLFFPENYIIVEGSSDQEIMETVLRLVCKHKCEEIKVVSATSIERADGVFRAIEDMLRPIVANSPYKDKVILLVDKPNLSNKAKVEEFKKVLKDRLFTLPSPSLEEYLPSVLYEKAGLDKTTSLSEIKNARSYIEIFSIKKGISEAIAKVLSDDDLEHIPEFKKAAEAALAK